MSSQRYKGYQHYKMDSKNRVSIKAQWRPENGQPFYMLLTTAKDMPVVKILDEETYNKKVALIENDPDTDASEKDEILGQLAMFCAEVTVNEQGKMAIPKSLSDGAGIQPESEVTLAGRGSFLYLWTRENFQKFFDIEASQRKKDTYGVF